MAGPAAASLAGRTVGVTADRRAEDQAVLLRRLSAEVVIGSTLRTETEPAGDALADVTRVLIADPPDIVVANTGFGMRAWWERAARWDLAEALHGALAGARLAARGPKAAGAARSLGLEVWWRSPEERLDHVAAHLIDQGVAGRRVAVQLHGDDRSDVPAQLRAAGAEVIEVPVYRWQGPADEGPALELLARCCAGTLDAVTFTAGPAVRGLVDLAEREGRLDELLGRMNGSVLVMCVGPVCAQVARDEGIREPHHPEAWRLGSMVRHLAETLGSAGDPGPTP